MSRKAKTTDDSARDPNRFASSVCSRRLSCAHFCQTVVRA